MKNSRPYLSIVEQLKSDVVLRSGLTSVVVSFLSMLLLTVIIYVVMVERLETRVEEGLSDRHVVSVFNGTALSDTQRSLVQSFRRSLPVRDEGVFAWLDSAGTTTTGSVDQLECREGFYDQWLDVSLQTKDGMLKPLAEKDIDSKVHDRFRFLASQRGDRCLVFGSSMYDVDAVREKMLGLFVWLIPLCLLPAVLITLRQSNNLRKRLNQVDNVVQSIASGNLDARISIHGDDNIDRLAQSANQSFDRMQESVTAMQQLTSVMAHDLRAPLNRIAIPLDKAMRANEAGDAAPDLLEEVHSGLGDVRSVFDALLRISQIESGRRRSHFKEIDLFVISERVYEIYQPVVEDEELTLDFEIMGEGKSCILGDSELITQALVNLIENAIRYAPKGAVVRISVLRDPLSPAIIVEDNGPGIPEKERQLVLRRLYRYEASTGGKSGHGLGLSLVKAVVETHDGELTLRDAKPGLLVRMSFTSEKAG